MKCPKCGATIEDGSKFCDECGAAIPQSKECPKCHAQLKPNAKFCSECGYSFSGQSAAGGIPMMGDKNVIAGDVTLTQTIVNQDETKKVVECCVCKRPVAITEAFVCSDCGGHVCKTHYDAESKLCSSCLAKKNAAAETEYRALLTKVLADGIIEKAEFKQLESLRTKLGIPQQRAKELLDEARAARSSVAQARTNDVLQKAEREKLDEARNAVFQEGLSKKAVELLANIYTVHPQNEEVLDVYLPALARSDAEKARALISKLNVDYKCAYLTMFDMLMRDGDLIAAESKLLQLEEMWPNDPLIACRRAEYLCACFMETDDREKLNEAEDIVIDFDDSDDCMLLSWQMYVRHLASQCLGDDLIDDVETPWYFTDGCYAAVASGANGGYIEIGYHTVLGGITEAKFLTPNKVILTLPQIRALKYLSDAGNPFAKLDLADCCVFGNGPKKYGGANLYEEAYEILKDFDRYPDDSVPVKTKLGTYYEEAPVAFNYSYAALRMAICFKKGIGCKANSMMANFYWDKFKEDSQCLHNLLTEKYGDDFEHWPIKYKDRSKLEMSDFEFENFQA